MWHDDNKQIIGYRMAEMDLSMATSKKSAKYCEGGPAAVFYVPSFYCREKFL